MNIPRPINAKSLKIITGIFEVDRSDVLSKHPQSSTGTFVALIPIAIVKIIKRAVRIRADSLIKNPATRKAPSINSNHGKRIATDFTANKGSIS
jgi:hypothetical protein